MTLKEAIESVGVGYPRTSQGIWRIRRLNSKTRKYAVSYSLSSGGFFSAIPPEAARVWRDNAGHPYKAVATKTATKAERAIIERIKFQEVAE